MKKFITLLVILFSSLALSSCFGELNTLEWETLPQSVYAVNDQAATTFMIDVSVKINGAKVSLQDAVDEYGATVSGFDVSSEGSRVITVKYQSLTIYWAYQVGATPSNVVTPEYDWYDGASSTYTLSSIEDLYGFANIVNGKDSKTPDNFAGETVKLAADIDLTGKVWEPIGASPRMMNHLLTYDDSKVYDYGTAPASANVLYQVYTKAANTDPAFKITRINHKGVIEVKDALSSTDFATKLSEYTKESEVKGLYFVSAYLYADRKDDAESNTIADFDFYYSSDVPVGNFFQGTFDGQGHKIKGLSDVGYTPTVVFTYANSAMMVTGYTFGLFGVVKNNVTVRNITFEDVAVVGAYYDSTKENLVLAEIDCVGAAIGYAFGNGNLTVDNVKVLSGSIVAQMAAAGIVGRFYNNGVSLIQNCENRANVSLTGVGYHVGGIAGYSALNTGTQFINNTNYGNITASTLPSALTSRNSAGAMINYLGAGTTATNLFVNCRNFGTITGTSHDLGLVCSNASDRAGKITFVDCVNYGALHTNP